MDVLWNGGAVGFFPEPTRSSIGHGLGIGGGGFTSDDLDSSGHDVRFETMRRQESKYSWLKYDDTADKQYLALLVKMLRYEPRTNVKYYIDSVPT